MGYLFGAFLLAVLLIPFVGMAAGFAALGIAVVIAFALD